MRAPTDAEKATMPKPAISIHVMAGHVWECDVDGSGFPTSGPRPHYKVGDPGYPEGGYPDPRDVPRLMAEASARGIAERDAAAKK